MNVGIELGSRHHLFNFTTFDEVGGFERKIFVYIREGNHAFERAIIVSGNGIKKFPFLFGTIKCYSIGGDFLNEFGALYFFITKAVSCFAFGIIALHIDVFIGSDAHMKIIVFAV